jgi:prolyl oligopeptidase
VLFEAPRPRKTLLYGYGGFSISLRPGFSASRLHWLGACGGVYVLACLRGGGEFGERWHEAGTLERKQNVFDDAHAVAEHLVASGVATPRSLGIMGGSNGGLLVLAAVQQRPELFGAGIAQVPVADMLRFSKFTVGSLWRGEYGFAEEQEAHFRALLAYSPLHNVRAPASSAAQLPSLLVTTADHDDRVVPLHSFKVIAQLQAVAGASALQTRPLLIRIEEKAGHGAGKPLAKTLDELADIYAFLAHELDEEREREASAEAS